MQQQKYLRIWQLVNPQNDTFISTSKVIKWVQSLLNYQEPHQSQKYKINPNDKERQILKNNKKQKEKESNKKKIKDQKREQQKSKNQVPQFNEDRELFKKQITEQVILEYIQKYTQTDQYKIIPKPKPIVQIQKPKQQKRKHLKVSPQKKNTRKSLSKLTQNQNNQTKEKKYDQTLILLSYQESIFFYCWLLSAFKIDQKIFQQSLVAQKLRQTQIPAQQNEQNRLNQTQQQQNISKFKFLIHLTQRQLTDLNQESFINLKKHEPKLKLLFKHYAKLSHQFSRKVFTFEEANILQQMINLHQWMLFCKDWTILNARCINQNWGIGKINRQFLMDMFFKNSFYRKQMSFQMFERALIAISHKMYQDCDLNHFKPIQLLMSFLSIKNQDKFLQNLKIKKISYNQSDLLNCFKDKNRQAFSKIKIVKKLGNQPLQRSKSQFMKKQKFSSVCNSNPEKLNTFKKQQNYHENEFASNLTQIKMFNTERLMSKQEKQSKSLVNNFSNLSLSQKQNSNRKSAPQIGIHLPKIQNNRYFQKVPLNNHNNKFKQYIKQEIPESSSVFKNKITGYHKIYDLHNQNDLQNINTVNKISHNKINQLINSKLQNIF